MNRRMTRSYATFGILGGGALALISGVALLVTLTRQTIPALFVVFAIAMAVTALSMVAYLAVEVTEGTDTDE